MGTDLHCLVSKSQDMEKETTHRYGPNSFKLHRLPTPRGGEVLGLVGTNGIGKSTALKILAGKTKPNLGKHDDPPTWEDILKYFRGNELQGYFTRILEENIRAIIKPQYVDHIPKAVKGQVGKIISAKDSRGVQEKMMRELDLSHVGERDVDLLSGGELQRFAICVVAVQNADMYMLDEPSSYLDVKQRMKAAHVIRGLLDQEDAKRKYVLVVEHDLAVLDYLSDYICCLYGLPGVYGVVTMPFSVREGINIFLSGFIPTENMRFRQEELTFKVAQNVEDDQLVDSDKSLGTYEYPAMKKFLKSKQGNSFQLTVEPGRFNDSQIIVMVGENGSGKTTFIRMLAGLMESDPVGDSDKPPEVEGFSVSYKPQKISPKFEGSVRTLFYKKIKEAFIHPQFNTDVVKPMHLDAVIDQDVKHLSGGELQRVAITLCLGKPAQVYLIDEPSAYLDSEQRVVAAKIIKRFILHAKKVAFVVEHDFIMATYLADRVVVFKGTPGIDCTASKPQSLLTGMNEFLSMLEITFRRDPTNYRPRINKRDSEKDREQKKNGTYFYMDD